MFTIQEIDPIYYRKQTRSATIKIMAMFIVIGFITATLAIEWFGEYSSNKLVLNFMGAFVGLIITGFIVKTFFAKQAWMKEAIYAWRLKRNLMYITNLIKPIKEAVENEDEHAMKIMRFYHLGLNQMHKLEDNNQALLDIIVESKELAGKMRDKGLDIEQYSFDSSWVEDYRN